MVPTDQMGNVHNNFVSNLQQLILPSIWVRLKRTLRTSQGSHLHTNEAMPLGMIIPLYKGTCGKGWTMVDMDS